MADKNAAKYRQNFDSLVKQGVDPAWLQSKTGGAVENKSVSSLLSAYQKEVADKKNTEFLAKVPDALKNDPTFQSLPQDLKEVAIYNYEVQKTNNAQKAEALSKALEIATAQADPYWANIIRIAQTEVSNGLAEIKGDYNAQVENLGRQIGYIQEDLARNKTNLSLDQQQQLASLAADLTDRKDTFQRNIKYLGGEKAAQLNSLELTYNKQIDDITKNADYTTEEKNAALDKINKNFIAQRGSIIGSAADAGLTFSTKRKIAEQRLADDNKGLVESTMRSYNKTMEDLASERSYITAQEGMQKGNIERQFGQQTEEQTASMATAERQIQEARDTTQRKYAQQITELETEAARGNVTAQAQLQELQRKLQESIKSTGLTAEKFLGTENMPTGLPTIGNVPGQVYEQKTADVATRQDALYKELTGASLNF